MPLRWQLPSLGLACLFSFSVINLPAAEPLAGYSNYDEFRKQVDALAESKNAHVTSLGKSGQDRDLWLITLGAPELPAVPEEKGKPKTIPFANKPAWVIVGSIQPDFPLGSELALRMAQDLANQQPADEAVQKLLNKCTLYIIPRPDPDGLEKCFARPLQASLGNARATDDDRDFSVGEDPANDLNGDGVITQMRIADEAGTLKAHPDDPRVLIEIESSKRETGSYRVLSEGRDDDQDEKFNEDGSGGVNLNRNFTFHYAPFEPHTGPNPVSEPETRALADFLFSHPEIAGVLTFSTEDNLFHPWKHDGGKDKGEIRNTIASQDETVMNRLAEEFRELHGAKDCPASPAGKGSFGEWAYFHFGRWSLVSRAWWIPNVPAEEVKKEESVEEKAAEANDEKPKEEKKDEPPKKEPNDKRGAEDLNALRWLQRENIDGFVDWQGVEHPDFPGKKVEVGGFKPFTRSQPPAAELPELAKKHWSFLTQVVDQLPQLGLTDTKIESLGSRTFRITTSVINRGQLPTMPEMGAITEQPYPLQIEIELPDDTVWLLGHPRGKVDRLKGQGGTAEHTWLVRFPDKVPASVRIHVWGPAVGTVETSIDLPQ